MNLVLGVIECEADTCIIMVDSIVLAVEEDFKLFKDKFYGEYSKTTNGHMLFFKEFNIKLIANNVLF